MWEHYGTKVPELRGYVTGIVNHYKVAAPWMTDREAVGAITSLALAAIDTALWDLRCKRAGLPLWKMAGGAQPKVPVYTTEGGWLQLPVDALVVNIFD